MPLDDESSLSLLASLQREIDEMLAVTRREADEIRQRAKREASRYVSEERAALAAVEAAAFEETLKEGERRLEQAAAANTAALAALRDRLERRLLEAIDAVVASVTEDLS